MTEKLDIEAFTKTTFSAATRYDDNITHDVYQAGSGPVVMIIQEMPGISGQTLRLAKKFIDRGFTVVMPHLFGPLGKVSFASNLVRTFCLRKEFHLFQNNHSSPIVDWLKALCLQIKTEHNVKGIGVIGMCLTGNFAIALMADENVLTAVASQPSLPVFNRSGLQLSDDEIENIKSRIDRLDTKSEAPLKVLRFKNDPLCSGQKLIHLQTRLNDSDIERVQCTTLPGNGHSVLSLDFVDKQGHPTYEALQRLLDFFERQLAH